MESWTGRLSAAVLGRVRPVRGAGLGAAGLRPTGLSDVTVAGPPRRDTPLVPAQHEDLELSSSC